MQDVAIILAGGKGSRMNRGMPKSLEKVCGKPLICYILDILEKCGLLAYIVVCPGSSVRSLGVRYRYVTQAEPLGTGNALLVASKFIPKNAKKVLIVNGDGPIFDAQLLQQMLNLGKNAMKILVNKVEYENSFGRVLRDNSGAICDIKEAKDCTKAQLKIAETNAGLYCVKTDYLLENIRKIRKNNAQNEYYATDLVNLIYRAGGKIAGVDSGNFRVFESVNTVTELKNLDNAMQQFIQHNFEKKGVRFVGESYVECGCDIGNASTIYPGCYLGGGTTIGSHSVIYPNCTLLNVRLPDFSVLPPGTNLICKT